MLHRLQLDGLRALAFLAVFIHHAVGHAQWTGFLGVHLFFVLSGFLITRILANDSEPSLSNRLSRFYWRRTLRIFPLYYFTLAWLALLSSLPHPWWSVSYLLNIKVYLDRLWPNPTMHIWSLCVEEQFYLIWPLLFWLTAPKYRLHLILGLLVLSKISRAWFLELDTLPWYKVLTPICGEYLLWGALAGWWEKQDRPLRYPADVLVGFGVVLVVLALMLPADNFAVALLDGTPDGIGYALIVLGLWRSTSLVARVMSWSPLVYLGKISYGLYVYHIFIVVGPLRQLLPENTWMVTLGPWLFDLPVTILLATVSYYVLERPFLRLKDYRLPAATPAG